MPMREASTSGWLAIQLVASLIVFIQAGKKVFRPLFEVLGDPMHADAQGRVSDVAFAVYWLELLTRLGIVRQVPIAVKVSPR